MGNFFVNYQATDKEARLMKCERIRELREDGDYSQKQIADYLHVHQTTYSNYELNRYSIPIPVLGKLADFYGVSVDYLLGRTDKKLLYEQEKILCQRNQL